MKLQDFFEGMSRVAATVNVVTTDGPAGKGGITVSAMTSVTAEPPTLLICVHEDSVSCPIIIENQRFCVNVLKADQAELSAGFAGLLPFDETATFSGENWKTSDNGSPLFIDALVNFDCRISHFKKIGSHMVFFGEIMSVKINDGFPLIYVNRGYLEGIE